MNARTFNENFEIDRAARGVKANAKGFSPGFPETLTADGETWKPDVEYHFFDTSAGSVRTTKNLRRVGDHLGSLGLRVVPIAALRSNKDAALEDGQKELLASIEKLKEQIRALESEKSPKGRTLKYVLQAN